jgi:hypothetical protein
MPVSTKPCGHLISIVAVVAVLAAQSALGQVREPEDTLSAGEGADTLSDVSISVGHDSGPVREGSQTIGETSDGSVRSGPVSDANTRSMLSGPVSSISQGPISERRPSLSGGSVTEASTGAVKHDAASPLGERISEPLRELGPLQEKMRARREQAENAVIEAARQPAVAADVAERQGDAPTHVEAAHDGAPDAATEASHGSGSEGAEFDAGDGPVGADDVHAVER